VRGQTFFTGQTSRQNLRCEECLTGHRTAGALAAESWLAPQAAEDVFFKGGPTT